VASSKSSYNESMMMYEVKGWFFLVASFILLLVICGLATLGLLTRPLRWSERS
jgi:hypothetical protein